MKLPLVLMLFAALVALAWGASLLLEPEGQGGVRFQGVQSDRSGPPGKSPGLPR